MFISKLYKKIRFMSLHLRIVIICLCFMCVSMLIIGAYLSAVLYKKSYDEVCEKMQIHAEKTVQNMDQSFLFIVNTAMAVSTGGTIGAWIDDNSLLESDNSQYYANVNRLKEEVKHVIAYSNAWKSNYISFICIFVDDELILNTYSKPIPDRIMEKSAVWAYQQVSKEPGDFIGGLGAGDGDSNLYYIKTMKRDFSTGSELSIMVAINEPVIRETYMSGLPSDEMKVYLTNADGMVFSSNDEEKRGQMFDEDLLSTLREREDDTALDQGDSICFSMPLASNRLSMVTMIPKSYIVGEAFQELPMFIMITIILCLFLLVIGFFISFRSTRFIHDLVYAMSQVKQENYEIQMPHYRNASVDVLSDAFNDMTRAMKALINDTYESKIMLQEMELEFLQQQMNPHFLFNILTTIQIKAKMSSDETIYEMLKSLSGLLRATLYSDQNVMTTLSEEMKYVQFYLYLQKQRFREKLDYTIEIPEELRQTKIPRLTIEPIVENSVVHGAEGGTSRVRIWVRAYREEQDVVIVIKDDGKGFEVESVEWDLNRITKESTREKLGLRNTNSRLKMLYGERFALVIESAPGKGTTVVVRVPGGC